MSKELSLFLKSYKETNYSLRVTNVFTFWARIESRLPTEPLASFSKEETMISKRAFIVKSEQLSQSREEVALKTRELCFLGLILSTYMGMRFYIKSSPRKPCSGHGHKKVRTY